MRVNRNMAVDIKIEIKNLAQIRAAFKRSPAIMTKNLNTAIRKVVFNIRGRAVSNAPAITGRLRGSAYTTFGIMKGETGFRAKYATFIHEGVNHPWIIEPRNKKALYWRGASHPVRRVRHPGIKANPFLRKAVDQTQSDTDRFFKEAVDDTLNEIGKASG